jgi:hypothetical protein
MPLVHFGKAPYAPSGAVIAVLEKHRQVRLPKIDDPVLEARIGVSEALRPRVLASLELLEFIDGDGVPTAEFARLPNLTDADYKPAVAGMLRKVYAPIIEDVKAEDVGNPDAVEAAFRSFTPTGQIKRMVHLYLGLMAYAGVIAEAPRRRSKSDAPAPRPRVTSQNKPDVKEKVGQTPPPLDLPPATPSAYSKSINLAGGAGSITLSGTVNPFALKGASRDFVFALIDLMDDYEISAEHGAPGATSEVKS